MPHSVSTTDSPSFFQLVLFLAAAAASPQDLSPADAIFLRVVLLHVSLGRPFLLVPSGAQPRLTFVISAGLLKTCPMYRHLLFSALAVCAATEAWYIVRTFHVPTRTILRGAVRKSRAEVAVVASPVELGLLPVMNPGLGCGSRLRPPSWKIVCWVSVTTVVLRYWMVSPVNNFVIPRRTRSRPRLAS